MYTLTAGAASDAPQGWTLQGSNDGMATHYRLVFDAAGGVTLAELELLGTPAGAETGDHPSKRELERRKPKPGPSDSIERNYG